MKIFSNRNLCNFNRKSKESLKLYFLLSTLSDNRLQKDLSYKDLQTNHLQEMDPENFQLEMTRISANLHNKNL